MAWSAAVAGDDLEQALAFDGAVHAGGAADGPAEFAERGGGGGVHGKSFWFACRVGVAQGVGAGLPAITGGAGAMQPRLQARPYRGQARSYRFSA